jgi:hypothetical protein
VKEEVPYRHTETSEIESVTMAGNPQENGQIVVSLMDIEEADKVQEENDEIDTGANEYLEY